MRATGQSTEKKDKPHERPANIDTSSILFGPVLNAELFNVEAKKVAKKLLENGDEINKPTQLRRFYDEICLWTEKVDGEEHAFQENLPFIRMMNAKAAYANGRKLVDKNFVKLMHDGLSQVKDAATMRHFKLFMEAVMGFYKEMRPKDS
ncbi:MAG: type III-A CRISPR-associated protein Csm2 [Magnetococcales bacterium]|nr:type III-A CRISPR-associated protein Csm2 [Magnetococcales bacterium]